ncbi:hypothetical protein [Mycobacterium sp. 1245111.1]|uniref:hypothetical protein n=1 Tax=Mycobacterium sp. 1245111.1 TaxID=1834073 RepID=UPI000AAEC9C4|nr:hypothetical protein [Mycobacterium sp. 1245111.1]
MDVYVIVDSVEHPAFRRPGRVTVAVDDAELGPIRTVTVLDRDSGLTSTARNDDIVN